MGSAVGFQIQDYAPLDRNRENQHPVIRPGILTRDAQPITATDLGFVIVTSHVLQLSHHGAFIIAKLQQ